MDGRQVRVAKALDAPILLCLSCVGSVFPETGKHQEDWRQPGRVLRNPLLSRRSVKDSQVGERRVNFYPRS